MELVKLEEPQILALYTEGKAMDPLIESVRETVRNFEHDLTTAAGRAKTASLSAKVSKAKTFLDALGKDLVSEWKEKSRVVDNVRKAMRDELDALRDEARAPLTEWEDAEKSRLSRLESSIACLKQYAIALENETSSAYKNKLDLIESIKIDDSYEERKAEAFEEKENAINFLKSKIATCEKREAEQAELEKLRAEAEARAKADREEALRKEGEQRAQREAEAKIKAEQARIEAEAKAKEEASARAELAARRATEEAERKLKESEERARMAEENTKRKAEAETKAIADETARREANAKHNKKIKTEAKECLIALGLDEKMAIAVVIAIDEKKIKNVSIAY